MQPFFSIMNKHDFRIVFMGTPDFAVESLKALVNSNFNIVGVITSPDRPAGRGQKLNQSAVKQYALEKGLNILQPTNLKDDAFQKELKALNAHLQVIVAFRMLPESVWNMPLQGSINLHGSLLPHYRGAAPINWAVINGEEKTGVTTFFLKHEIDTGDIIDQVEIAIEDTDNAGTIHDKLMVTGAKLLVETTQSVMDGTYKEIPQQQLIDGEIKHAPKIFKPDCKINWEQPVKIINNLVRGLSPYPSAWSQLIAPDEKTIDFKIFKTTIEKSNENYPIGSIISDGKTYLKVAAADGLISILELQLSGKKRLPIADLLRGFQINNNFKVG